MYKYVRICTNRRSTGRKGRKEKEDESQQGVAKRVRTGACNDKIHLVRDFGEAGHLEAVHTGCTGRGQQVIL